MTTYSIPFNKPTFTGKELNYVVEAVQNGQISGGGDFTRRCEKRLEEMTGARKALLATSCTHALEMATILLGVGDGDEVLMPSFTFVSTANAVVLRGARPVFIDIRPDTLNLDENRLEESVTPETRAVTVVHYAGVGCEMETIDEIARRRDLQVLEDNAHGLLASYRGRPLGSLGHLATLSFHETKNIICGEGGALLINDPRHVERAEVIREKGTDRSRFFRGEVDKYTWVDIGSSYVPSDLLAAFLLAQLEAADDIQHQRQRLWQGYHQRLADWAAGAGVRLPTIPADCQQSFHMFYLICPSAAHRAALIAHLKSQGILAVFHYVPLHLSTMGRRWGYRRGSLPVTEDLSERLVRLPFYRSLSDADLDRVTDAVITAGRNW